MKQIDKDRNSLKRLVESYGKKDVIKYIDSINEARKPNINCPLLQNTPPGTEMYIAFTNDNYYDTDLFIDKITYLGNFKVNNRTETGWEKAEFTYTAHTYSAKFEYKGVPLVIEFYDNNVAGDHRDWKGYEHESCSYKIKGKSELQNIAGTLYITTDKNLLKTYLNENDKMSNILNKLKMKKQAIDNKIKKIESIVI